MVRLVPPAGPLRVTRAQVAQAAIDAARASPPGQGCKRTRKRREARKRAKARQQAGAASSRTTGRRTR